MNGVSSVEVLHHTSDSCNDKQCVEQPSISLEPLKVNKDPTLIIDELNQKAENSKEDSDQNQDTIKSTEESIGCDAFNLHETSLHQLRPVESAVNMYDAEFTRENLTCQSEVELDNDSNDVEVPHRSITKGLNNNVPYSETQLDDENQESASKGNKITTSKILDSYTTPKKSNLLAEINGQEIIEKINSIEKINQGIFYSTPNVSTKLGKDSNSDAYDDPYFGYVSPLIAKSHEKQNLKRKHVGLQPIEEMNEDEENDTISEKKIKIEDCSVETMDETVKNTDFTSEHKVTTEAPGVIESSSSLHYEAPAKHLLKMWQPSCLSRNVSASGFIVLDEYETDTDDCQDSSSKFDPSKPDTSKIDDFEIAYQSLSEELMKSSSQIETLEKYHSQVQLESQLDDEKFDEIWKELTMNVDLENTCLSIKSMDESTITDMDKTLRAGEPMDESFGNFISDKEKTKEDQDEYFSSENNQTVIESNDTLSVPKSPKSIIARIKEETDKKTEIQEQDFRTEENEEEEEDEESEDETEENSLIKGNNNENDYEFFEYISLDPKENEDNYNPEWQKLGKLTTDEERYKAVRDRWRSLVPPDPNRNLTYRQWRARNSLPPIEFVKNDKYSKMDDKCKNQLCTVVFDEKINSIWQDVENSRMDIFRKRNQEFEVLGQAQDAEQLRARRSGISYQGLTRLHTHHLNQCRTVKLQYDEELKRIKEITEAKIRILKECSVEVLHFQKFYKGVGARNDNEMYMTDIQVQELVETEEMLETYRSKYETNH